MNEQRIVLISWGKRMVASWIWTAAFLFGGICATWAQDTCAVNATGAQQIKGWGTYPSEFDSNSSMNTGDIFDKPAIQDALYNIGITHIRARVEPALYVSGTDLTGANAIVLNQSRVNDLVGQIQIAKEHGVNSYILSCWSPPAVWKTNGHTVGTGGCLLVAAEPFFVNFYIKVLQALQAAGVGLPAGLSVQNEPDITNNSYDTCDYVNDTQTGGGFALWRKLFEDMHAALVANGMSSVTLFGPECASTDNDINLLGASPNFNLMTVPAFSSALGAYASHTYGENIWLGIRQGERDFPRDGWITEWSATDTNNTENGWSMETMAHMASNLVDIPYNYWTFWAEWNSGSAPTGTCLTTGTVTPVLSERYFIFQKLWTTVRPGWVVHSMTCSDTNYTTINSKQNTFQTLVDLVSFWNPSGNACVTMLINKTANTTSMSVSGLVGTQYSAYQSDATHNMVNISNGTVSSGSAIVSLAPTSITLLITSSAAQPAPTGLTAGASNPGATLSWPASYGSTGYNVKRAISSAGPFTTVGTTGVGTALVYNDTTAVAGTTYYYEVTALYPSGESGPCNVASIQVPTIRLALADTYVNDGTSAGTNFGTNPDLLVKAGPTSFNRESFLRFDVSGLANAQNVQVWLVPDIVGTDAWSSAVQMSYETIPNDTWSESALTWNTSRSLVPTPHTPFTAISGGYFVGVPIVLDVTSQAKAQASIDGLLSLHVYSTSNSSDSQAFIEFASKENTVPGYRPVLVYTMPTGFALSNPGFESGTSGWSFAADNGMSTQ